MRKEQFTLAHSPKRGTKFHFPKFTVTAWRVTHTKRTLGSRTSYPGSSGISVTRLMEPPGGRAVANGEGGDTRPSVVAFGDTKKL